MKSGHKYRTGHWPGDCLLVCGTPFGPCEEQVDGVQNLLFMAHWDIAQICLSVARVADFRNEVAQAAFQTEIHQQS